MLERRRIPHHELAAPEHGYVGGRGRARTHRRAGEKHRTRRSRLVELVQGVVAGDAERIGDALAKDDNDILNISARDTAKAYFTSASVYFDGVCKIRVRYTLVEGDYTFYVDGNEVDGANGVLETDGIYANAFGEAHTFEIKDGAGNVVQSLEYNVYAYCTQASASANVNMANLAIALDAYGLATEAYEA
jgi:hypothetical protein